jgi:gluconolactonase
MNHDAHELWLNLSRRHLLGVLGAAGVTAFAPRPAPAQPAAPRPAEPPSTVSTPPRDFTPGAQPVTYPDPDLVTVDPAFNGLRLGNTPILRLWTGALWSEGPAWSNQGRYLVWSDIPNNRQLRWIEDDGRVTVFRAPSNNSNGNTFDFEGRQLSCEHLTRRVVRYENDGTITVIADAYDGKPLNSPNDVVPHPDGGYWFTTPFGWLFTRVMDAPEDQATAGTAPAAGNPRRWATRRELPTNVHVRHGCVSIAIG